MSGHYVTPEGFKKIQEELKELKTVKRLEISQRIETAKELGDLSENAEYAEAKDQQAFMEGRILELESLLQGAMVVTEHSGQGFITVGSVVHVLKDGVADTYTIVGTNESDPLQKKVSNESPIGQILLGKKKGDVVDLNLKKGMSRITIVEVV